MKKFILIAVMVILVVILVLVFVIGQKAKSSNNTTDTITPSSTINQQTEEPQSNVALVLHGTGEVNVAIPEAYKIDQSKTAAGTLINIQEPHAINQESNSSMAIEVIPASDSATLQKKHSYYAMMHYKKSSKIWHGQIVDSFQGRLPHIGMEKNSIPTTLIDNVYFLPAGPVTYHVKFHYAGTKPHPEIDAMYLSIMESLQYVGPLEPF
jgi:hypothetical protein